MSMEKLRSDWKSAYNQLKSRLKPIHTDCLPRSSLPLYNLQAVIFCYWIIIALLVNFLFYSATSQPI